MTTPNHQKQCECKEPKKFLSISTRKGRRIICNNCGLPPPPQEEKVSEEKLYYLRGGTPEGYEKLNTALKSVEPQIGGALRRLQAQDEARMEKGAKLFSRDFTETIEDLAKEDSAAPENDSWTEEFDKLWWPLSHGYRKTSADKLLVDAWNGKRKQVKDYIKKVEEAAHARGKREERERARKLILQFDQEMTDQNVGDSYFEARNRLMALLEEARKHE